MLARSVIQIIEKMGFVWEDVNRWVADFLFDQTGNVLTIVAYEGENEEGIPRLLFDACDGHGNTLSTSTLDQMMFEMEKGTLILVPTKSNKKYKVGISMYVETEVDMDAIFPETYRMYIEDEDCRSEKDIVKRVAKADLKEYYNGAPFTTSYFAVEEVTEITK